MSTLWIATANAHKAQELQRLLACSGYTSGHELRTLGDLENPPLIVEDQADFAGNAAQKAGTLARAVSATAIGDDSGLCVDALDGRPGVHSSRYAGAEAGDAACIDRLLSELDGVPSTLRTAHFTCAICLADARGRILATFEERCEGLILDAPRGDGGFGYDPVFVARQHLKRRPAPSFAELAEEEKDAISHRGRALRRLAVYLDEHAL